MHEKQLSDLIIAGAPHWKGRVCQKYISISDSGVLSGLRCAVPTLILRHPPSGAAIKHIHARSTWKVQSAILRSSLYVLLFLSINVMLTCCAHFRIRQRRTHSNKASSCENDEHFHYPHTHTQNAKKSSVALWKQHTLLRTNK